MSPEQIRGKELDARTDLFSFGAVLYEMATGMLPFRGDTSGVIFDSILNRQPAPAIRLNPDVPAKLEEIIAKALEKDRDVRCQSAAEIRADLKRLKRDTESGRNATEMPRRSYRTMMVIAAVLTIVIVFAGVGAFYLRNSHEGINSIAVLPFTNTSGNPDSEYLSDGITEGVIDRLSELPNLRVISRTSAFHYKGRDIDTRKVAKELGVEALVTGRVVQHGDDLSVSTELVDAHADKQLWGEQYSRKLADIHVVQQEIATAISGNLRVKLTSEEKARLAKPRATNAESYQLYLKGRYYADKASLEGLKRGVEYFQQAIQQDPSNALAYAALAQCYADIGGFAYVPPDEVFPQANDAAVKALVLDDSLADAHAALGYVKFAYNRDWSGAEAEFKQAIQLNPGSVDASYGYAQLLNIQGRSEESLARDRRAQELDPVSPRIVGLMGAHYLAAGRYVDSISQLKRALELDPAVPWLHSMLSWAYVRQGEYAQAIAENEKMGAAVYPVSAENQLFAAGLGWIYALAGRRSDALKVLTQLKELNKHAFVDHYNLAMVYAGLGDKDQAFAALERAYEQHSTNLAFLKADPFWNDAVRSDPRYKDLLRRMGLPQ
jgi:TolB-like protein/Flp pilus assembly protein TadD